MAKTNKMEEMLAQRQEQAKKAKEKSFVKDVVDDDKQSEIMNYLSLESMSLVELKNYAVSNNIELGKASTEVGILKKIKEGKKVGEEEEKEELIQRSYYFTEDHIKAITMKTMDENLDKSGAIRAALEIFLKDELEYIRSKK